MRGASQAGLGRAAGRQGQRDRARGEQTAMERQRDGCLGRRWGN